MQSTNTWHSIALKENGERFRQTTHLKLSGVGFAIVEKTDSRKLTQCRARQTKVVFTKKDHESDFTGLRVISETGDFIRAERKDGVLMSVCRRCFLPVTPAPAKGLSLAENEHLRFHCPQKDQKPF